MHFYVAKSVLQVNLTSTDVGGLKVNYLCLPRCFVLMYVLAVMSNHTHLVLYVEDKKANRQMIKRLLFAGINSVKAQC